MRRPCPGLALVELLVALALGLMVVLAGASAYLGASEASRMADAQARLQDDAQVALAVLAQQLRMAGSRDLHDGLDDASATSPGLRGCDGNFQNIQSDDGFDALVCAADGASEPHAFAVRYQADRFNTLPTRRDEPTDCMGNALAPRPRTPLGGNVADPVYIAENRFFIGRASGTGVPSLYCKGAGGTAQPLAENVEDLRLLYGVAASASQAAVAGYRTARELNAATQHGVPDAWALVRAVQLCIVVRSEQQVSDPAWSHYRRCDGELETHAPDRRLRRSFTTTVALRNVPGSALPLLPGASPS